MSQASVRELVEADFMGWPAFVLRQGPLALHVVPCVGGRLMGIAVDGEELCFVNPLLQGRLASDAPDEWAALCGDWDFPLWGGGKTWLAPESAWPGGAPHRDLDSGAWNVSTTWFDDEGMGIALASPVCRQSGLQLRRRLTLPAAGSGWFVDHQVINTSGRAVFRGLWDVLMLKRPALVHLPVPRGQAWHSAVHALPGRPSVAALKADGILRPGEDSLAVACNAPGAFKCGFDSTAGVIGAELRRPSGTLRYQRHSAIPAHATWAHGHPLELFNAPALPYFEIETHSPATTLQPGERLTYRVEEAVQRLPQPHEGDFS